MFFIWVYYSILLGGVPWQFSAQFRRCPRRVGHDVHSARAHWASYVARSATFSRPLEVSLARFLTLPPSTPALSRVVFGSTFLHSSRFSFPLAPFPSLSYCSHACRSRHWLECSVPFLTPSVCSSLEVFCCRGSVASQGRGVGVGCEEPHLRVMF